MAAFWMHSTMLWRIASSARDRAIAAVRENPEANPSDATIALVFSAMAAEGFINELATYCAAAASHEYVRSTKGPTVHQELGTTIAEIEKSKGSSLLKYLMASKILSGTMLDKGANPYQDLQDLFALRNEIVHLKLIDQAGKQVDKQMTFEMPKLVRTFQGRGLALNSPPDIGASWFAALQTDRMAIWSCAASLNAICAILDMMPTGSGIDAGQVFKVLFFQWRTEQAPQPSRPSPEGR